MEENKIQDPRHLELRLRFSLWVLCYAQLIAFVDGRRASPDGRPQIVCPKPSHGGLILRFLVELNSFREPVPCPVLCEGALEHLECSYQVYGKILFACCPPVVRSSASAAL